jgi:hypothetical protein
VGFLTKAIGRRVTRALDEFSHTPDGQAAIERNERRMAVARMTREVAGGGLDDNAALAELRERLPQDSEASRGAIDHLAARRTSYLDDRAYRLLIAAVTDTAIGPIDPAVSDQFLAEAVLGRMSLAEAFEHLAELEPRLRDVPVREQERRWGRCGWSFRRAEPELVGAWAETRHPILNTDLAAAVVREYRLVTGQGRVRAVDNDPTPFFERKKRSFGGSFALFGGGDTRPRARN